MAYDPSTGQWKDEDTSVENRVRGLLKEDSEYLQQGRAAGQMDSQRRGLLNSSIAVQAGEAARIDRALPIASQDASQANQREMQGRSLQSAKALQDTSITAQKELQGTDIASREKMQATDVEAQKSLATFDAGTREKLQNLDSQTRLQLQQLDTESQERIVGMNISTDERTAAAKLAATLELGYASMLATIMDNADIPADVRQQYMDHANKMRDSNLGLIEQFYNIDLEWDAAPAGP